MDGTARDEALSPGTDNRWAPQRRRTWFAIAGAPVAWGLHLAGAWYVSGNACLLRNGSWGSLSRADVWAVQAAVAIVCAGVAAAALVIALLDWRASGNAALDDVQASARPDFLAAVALMVSAAFLLAVLYNALAQVMLPLCEAIR